MKIARFMIGGRPTVAVDGGEGFVDYGAVLEARGMGAEITSSNPERRLIRMINRGTLDEEFIAEQLNWARAYGGKWRVNVEGLTPLLPLRPCKILCVARNWESHARERGHRLPDRPVYFAKTENSALGPGMSILIPDGVGRVDHEGELGVVIGRRGRRVKAEDAERHIIGYTLINDVTARDLQHQLSRRSWPWFAAKSMDTFAPLGPFIVSRREAEPLTGKRIRVTVNGELRQDGALDDMHWKVPDLIEEISRYITLEPGDVIATGTPSGTGPLEPGDEVKVSIDGIGELVNRVRSR